MHLDSDTGKQEIVCDRSVCDPVQPCDGCLPGKECTLANLHKCAWYPMKLMSNVLSAKGSAGMDVYMYACLYICMHIY